MINVNQIWKQLHKTKNLKSKHVVERAIIRAINKTEDDERAIQLVLRDLMKSFVPRTNKNALANGYDSLFALKNAIWSANLGAGGKDGTVLGAPIDALGILKDRYKTVASLLSSKQPMCRCNGCKEHDKLGIVDEYFGRNYVYIFVRQDISPEYQLVQASHVALRLGYELSQGDKFNSFDPRDLYFTIVGVEDLHDLNFAKSHLKDREIRFTEFFEPDIDSVTAIASWPVHIRDRGDLLQYKLLRFNNG